MIIEKRVLPIDGWMWAAIFVSYDYPYRMRIRC